MNYDDLKRMEQRAINIRQNGFKDCASRVMEVVDYHLAANPGIGVAEMNEEQLRDLVCDMMLVANQLEKYGESIPDE